MPRYSTHGGTTDASDNPTGEAVLAATHSSAHHFARLIVRAVDDARTRGDARCLMCQWVFTSSITHDERHPDWCGYKQAKDALNDKLRDAAT